MTAGDYEAQRLEIIARNRARLQQLGLGDAADKFAAATTKPKKPTAPRKPKEPAGPPTRHSRRQEGEAPAELNDEERQVAAMYVDGICPKCGKAFEKGIKQHFDKCTGTPRRSRRSAGADVAGKIVGGPDHEEEDDNEQEEDQGVRKLPAVDPAKLAGKLKELEMSGLIDFGPDAAKFAVLGSTGSKYVVTLSDKQHSCQCMDFRIRRRECKHIKLVLQQLGVAKSPAEWHQAVDRQLDAAAAAEGGGAAAGDAPATDADEAGDGSQGPGRRGAKRKEAKPTPVAAKRQKAAAKAESKGGAQRGTRGSAKGSKTATAGSNTPPSRPGTRRLPKSLQ